MSQNTERLQDFLQQLNSRVQDAVGHRIEVPYFDAKTFQELLAERIGKGPAANLVAKIEANHRAGEIKKARELDPLFDFAMMVEELNHPTK